jgi:hypothetical protein
VTHSGEKGKLMLSLPTVVKQGDFLFSFQGKTTKASGFFFRKGNESFQFHFKERHRKFLVSFPVKAKKPQFPFHVRQIKFPISIPNKATKVSSSFSR